MESWLLVAPAAYPQPFAPRLFHLHKGFHAITSSCAAHALRTASPAIRDASCAAGLTDAASARPQIIMNTRVNHMARQPDASEQDADQHDANIDQQWLQKNLDTLLRKAQGFYQEHGRGALLIDHRERQQDAAIRYIPQSESRVLSQDEKRMLREYDPNAQAVVALLKPGNRLSV